MKAKGLVRSFALILGAAATQAAVVPATKVSIPFPFHVNGKVMPAGQYRVHEDPANGRAVIVNARTGDRVQVLLSFGDHTPGQARLTFEPGKKGYALKSVE